MRPFNLILRDAMKDTREAGRRISPTNLLKVSGLGDNMTVYDLSPPEQPKTFVIAVLNGRYRNTCKLDDKMISDMHAKHPLHQVRKGISILTEALQRDNKKKNWSR